MPLVIRHRTTTSIPLEVDSIRLEAAREQSASQVASTLVQFGNRRVPLGEFFDVSGSAADNEIVWEGDCSRVKLIGAGLAGGRIRVDGQAGMHLGAEMTAGEILVDGSAADWLGAEMHGGLIHVHGDAGHLVGAVYRGGRRGMTGGEILVDGDAGNEIGHTMRRGLIAIGGRAGDAVGVNMIAGSVLVFGDIGIRAGADMRRGTIGLFGDHASIELLPTFKPAGRSRPVFVRYLLKHLQQHGWELSDACLDADYQRFCGDFLESGQGEILVRVDDRLPEHC